MQMKRDFSVHRTYCAPSSVKELMDCNGILPIVTPYHPWWYVICKQKETFLFKSHAKIKAVHKKKIWKLFANSDIKSVQVGMHHKKTDKRRRERFITFWNNVASKHKNQQQGKGTNCICNYFNSSKSCYHTKKKRAVWCMPTKAKNCLKNLEMFKISNMSVGSTKLFIMINA